MSATDFEQLDLNIIRDKTNGNIKNNANYGRNMFDERK